MKQEPLKRKLIYDNQCVTKESPSYVEDYFMKEDIKSAVEWLRNKQCDCKNISNQFDRCHNCDLIDKAFEDVNDNKEDN